jgi:hypothetical protein
MKQHLCKIDGEDSVNGSFDGSEATVIYRASIGWAIEVRSAERFGTEDGLFSRYLFGGRSVSVFPLRGSICPFCNGVLDEVDSTEEVITLHPQSIPDYSLVCIIRKQPA